MHSTNRFSRPAQHDQIQQQDGAEDLKKLSVQVPRTVHQQLKMFAIRNETSITSLILKVVDDLLAQDQNR